MSWAEILEQGGFLRSVAGEKDFDSAVEAAGKMTTDPKLGIIISGEYGVGKSVLARAICAKLSNPPIIVDLADSAALAMLTDEWMDLYATNLFEQNVLLDDLGAEKPVNDFGVRIERAADFICSYHSRGKERLVITTNLTSSEIDERYGGRVLSRLKDLCTPLRLNGKDKRKWQL